MIDLQAQNNGLQPQYTVQPQLTAFNPYQQQAQQEAMQVRVSCFFDRLLTGPPFQAEWERQQRDWLAQQQQQLQLQAQQEEWMRQQLAQQQLAQQQAAQQQASQQQAAQQQALLAQQQQEYLAAQARLVPQPTAFGFGVLKPYCLFKRTDILRNIVRIIPSPQYRQHRHQCHHPNNPRSLLYPTSRFRQLTILTRHPHGNNIHRHRGRRLRLPRHRSPPLCGDRHERTRSMRT